MDRLRQRYCEGRPEMESRTLINKISFAIEIFRSFPVDHEEELHQSNEDQGEVAEWSKAALC